MSLNSSFLLKHGPNRTALLYLSPLILGGFVFFWGSQNEPFLKTKAFQFLIIFLAWLPNIIWQRIAWQAQAEVVPPVKKWRVRWIQSLIALELLLTLHPFIFQVDNSEDIFSILLVLHLILSLISLRPLLLKEGRSGFIDHIVLVFIWCHPLIGVWAFHQRISGHLKA